MNEGEEGEEGLCFFFFDVCVCVSVCDVDKDADVNVDVDEQDDTDAGLAKKYGEYEKEYGVCGNGETG